MAPLPVNVSRLRLRAVRLTIGGPDRLVGTADFLEQAAARNTPGLACGDVSFFIAARFGVALFDQEPVLLANIGRLTHSHERPTAAQLVSTELEVQTPAAIARVCVSLRLPCTLVPDHNASGAILIRWNRAFEAGVLQRMVFDMNREAFVAGIQTRALRHRPALEGAIELQTKVVVQATRLVHLDDE